MNNPTAVRFEDVVETLELSALLRTLGPSFGAIIHDSLCAIVGETGAAAAEFHMQDKALRDPGVFVERMYDLFGDGGGKFLLSRLFMCTEPHRDYDLLGTDASLLSR